MTATVILIVLLALSNGVKINGKDFKIDFWPKK